MGSPRLALFSGCYPGRPGLHPRANVGPGDAPRSGGRSEPRPRERERERKRKRERHTAKRQTRKKERQSKASAERQRMDRETD